MLHPTWPLVLRLTLAVHILSGVIAFVCAPIALVTVKGGRTHRKWGKVYFWAMAVVAATALALSLTLPILFLGLVAVFSFYQAFFAYRALHLKNLYAGGKAGSIDWVAAGMTFTCSMALSVAGIVIPNAMRIGVIRVGRHPISVVSVFFGVIGMATSYRTTRSFLRRPTDRVFWWYQHLQGMLASYIAALTAFSAVNLSHWFGSAWWVWLWPTLIGVPAISIWTRYYKKKFARWPNTVSRSA